MRENSRAGSVHVLLEDRHPVVGEVSGQLELDARVVLVVGCDAGECLLATQLPRQLAPILRNDAVGEQ